MGTAVACLTWLAVHLAGNSPAIQKAWMPSMLGDRQARRRRVLEMRYAAQAMNDNLKKAICWAVLGFALIFLPILLGIAVLTFELLRYGPGVPWRPPRAEAQAKP